MDHDTNGSSSVTLRYRSGGNISTNVRSVILFVPSTVHCKLEFHLYSSRTTPIERCSPTITYDKCRIFIGNIFMPTPTTRFGRWPIFIKRRIRSIGPPWLTDWIFKEQR
jgi:hypothetical protein